MKISILLFLALFSLSSQAGFLDFLESLTHKETWKEPVESTLIVGGIVVTGAAIAGAASNGSSGGSSTNYTGNCEYDYDTAADGTSCGARSADSREGGWEP